MIIDLNKQQELISKRAILTYFNELDVYRLYLEPHQDAIPGTRILSPLRKETNPSFGFFVGESNEICFKDHLLGGGDCIRFVQMKFGLTYFEALSKIATDLDLDKDYICKSFPKSKVNDINNYPSRDNIMSKVTSSRLGKNRRQWQLHDKEFWLQYGITKATLEKYRVEPISFLHINDRIFRASKHAYCFTELKDGKETYKFYQPYDENFKWINNHDDSVWQGWEQLPDKHDSLIITKSLKDLMSINDVCGIPSIALQSENVTPKRHVFEQLRPRFEVIYLLYDNDFDKEINIGKLFGNKLAEELGIIPIFIDDEHQCKDFSDLVKKYGKDKANEILNNMLIPF